MTTPPRFTPTPPGSRAASTPKVANLVLQAGGVKGSALVGAVQGLVDDGYSFNRIAGSSAGAIAGGFLAAGIPVAKLHQLLGTVDFSKFEDPTLLSRLPVLGDLVSEGADWALNEGKVLHTFIRDTLAAAGVRTWADLKLSQPDPNLPPEQQYKFVCVVSDVSRGELIRFPWDYHLYGLDPDKQSVADAIYASSAIPFFFRPAKLTATNGQESYLVDGGLNSEFPFTIFDPLNSKPARFPTLAVALQPRNQPRYRTTDTVVDYIQNVIDTAINGHDRSLMDDPLVQQRTIFVNTDDVDATNFGITPAQREQLFQRGLTAAQQFVKTFDTRSFGMVRGAVQATRQFVSAVQGRGSSGPSENALS